jgi:hypothetical protein
MYEPALGKELFIPQHPPLSVPCSVSEPKLHAGLEETLDLPYGILASGALPIWE